MATVQSNAGVRSALKNRRCLGVLALSLYYFGLWPSDDAPNIWTSYWRHYLPRVQLVRWIYTIVFNTVSITIVWGTWHSVVMFTGNVVLYVAIITRFGSLYLQRHRLADVFTSLESLCSPRMLATEHLHKMAARTEKLSHRFFTLAVSTLTVIVLIMQANVLADGISRRILPFRLWMPYNYTSTPVFEITLVSSNVLFALDFAMLSFPSLLFVACCIHLLGQYKLLRYKIENIRILVEKKMDKSRTHKSASVSIDMDEKSSRAVVCTIRGAESDDSVSNHPADSETAQAERGGWWRVREVTMFRQHSVAEQSHVNEDGGGELITDMKAKVMKCDKESTGLNDVSVKTSVTPGEQNWRKMGKLFKERRDEQLELETGTSLEMEQFLRHCARHHQVILRLTKDFERVFKVALRFQSFGNAIGGLLFLYATTLAPTLDYKVIATFLHVALIYVEYFMYCWLGNQITQESERLREAVYGCEWYGASESFKRSIRIMISRTNKPEVLKAGGLPLSMKSFRFICRTGFYLHNVMVKIIHGVKINDKMS